MALQWFRRKRVMKAILWSIAILIIPAFIWWDIDTRESKRIKKDSYVGTIQGKKISAQEYQQMYRDTSAQVLINYWANQELLNNLQENMELITWNRLILLGEAKRQGIQVPDADVIAYITSQPLFSRNDAFDQDRYEEIIQKRLRMSPRDFEEQVRNTLRIEKMKNALIATTSVTDEEVRAAYRQRYETVTVEYALFTRDRYREDVTVSDEEIRAYYDSHQSVLERPVQYEAELLVVPADDTTLANSIGMDIDEGADLKTIAQRYQLATQKTGLFSLQQEIPVLGFQPRLVKIIPGLSPNQTSPLIRLQDGRSCVIRIDRIEQPRTPSLEEATEEVRAALLQEKALASARTAAAQIQPELAQLIDGHTFAEACAKHSLEYVSPDTALTRFSFIPKIGMSREFFETAFSLKEKELSLPVPIPQGAAIVYLDRFTPVDEERFSTEKTQFTQEVLAQKKQRILDEWFNAVAKDAHLNAPFK